MLKTYNLMDRHLIRGEEYKILKHNHKVLVGEVSKAYITRDKIELILNIFISHEFDAEPNCRGIKGSLPCHD